jgi:hypothetical protein
MYCARNLIENRVDSERLGETTRVETEGTHDDPGVYSTAPDTMPQLLPPAARLREAGNL